MSIYKICPDCGAHLDPGERCECEGRYAPVDEMEARRPIKARQLSMSDLYARHMGIDKEEYRK